MSRIKDITEQLGEYSLDGMLLTGEINRRYATGFKSSAGVVIITREKSYFLTDSRYIERARAQIRDVEVVQVTSGAHYTDLLNDIIERHQVGRLGFEEEVMTQAEYIDKSFKLAAQLVSAQKLMGDLRQSKSKDELELMLRAQEITDQTFAQLIDIISPEMTEGELAAEIVYRLLRNGAENISFEPIVVSGPRSSMPHGTPGRYKLEGFVTMDFGCIYEGYCSDMTRTVSIGRPTDEMRAVYEIVQEAQLAGIAAARGGVIGREVDFAARRVIDDAGFGEYFGHSFGHSLGMEIHEAPNAAPSEERPLPRGAVLSAEPGIYLPGRFGVRIEDTMYLTDTGNTILTKSPKNLIVL